MRRLLMGRNLSQPKRTAQEWLYAASVKRKTGVLEALELYYKQNAPQANGCLWSLRFGVLKKAGSIDPKGLPKF
jgi:hypothetical protein